MAEGLYDAVCYITSSPDNPKPTELVDGLDWRHFSAAISARVPPGIGAPSEHL
jgi:hypothetical protein